MLKFKNPGSRELLIDTLQLIARGQYDDSSTNKMFHASTLAYFALGGRIENGVKLDNVKDLCKKLGYDLDT
jgi:hypothetical protein